MNTVIILSHWVLICSKTNVLAYEANKQTRETREEGKRQKLSVFLATHLPCFFQIPFFSSSVPTPQSLHHGNLKPENKSNYWDIIKKNTFTEHYESQLRFSSSGWAHKRETALEAPFTNFLFFMPTIKVQTFEGIHILLALKLSDKRGGGNPKVSLKNYW